MAKAIIAGASGLIGGHLLQCLLQSPAYKEVTVLVRAPLPLSDPKLKQVILNFDDLSTHAPGITGHALFCCLGSTRKKTPDLGTYAKIDHDYPVQLAEIALANKMEQYHLVSSMGADALSSNFYTKMKGQVEEDIKKIGVNTLHIYRPSILSGQRNEHRPTERVAVAAMKIINLFLWGRFRKYRSISAEAVAIAMYKQSLLRKDGVFIHASDEIKELA
jgi:uncharacterized protein YbjT (DUF2867 family)